MVRFASFLLAPMVLVCASGACDEAAGCADAVHGNQLLMLKQRFGRTTENLGEAEDERAVAENDGASDVLKTKHDANCVDYNYNTGAIYMHRCHGASNQMWHLTDGGQLKTAKDDKCLDYNAGHHGRIVYMGSCHDGKNQEWYFDDVGRLRSRHDDRCLDYDVGSGAHNVYMGDCHGGNNQQFFFQNKSEALKIAAREPAFKIKVACDMTCLHSATEQSDTNIWDTSRDKTMCPKPWMVMATDNVWVWDSGSEEDGCDLDTYENECPNWEDVAETARVTDAHAVWDKPNGDCSFGDDCIACPTREELLRLPNPHSEDNPVAAGEECPCPISDCGFVPCCAKPKQMPCRTKRTNAPHHVKSLSEGEGLGWLVDMMKSAMIAATPTSTFLQSWMGKMAPVFGDATLLHISLPGTHDTATYDLSDRVSKNPYADTDVANSQFLADVLGFASKIDGSFVQSMGQAQGIDVVDQLDGGIRFLDFRIDFTWTNDVFGVGRKDDWFAMHGTQTKHPAVFHLAQLKAWLDRNPGEVVVLWMTRRGSNVNGESAFPGAEQSDKRRFWNQVTGLFGDLLFDSSQGSLSDTPINVMVERGQRLVWFAMDWVDFTGSSTRALDADVMDLVGARETVGGDEPRSPWQKTVFGDELKQNGNAFRLFSMAAVFPPTFMLDMKLSQQNPSHPTAPCQQFWKIPGMSLLDGDNKWCPTTLMDAALLLNYYNQEALEWAYADPEKNFPHGIYLDVVDRGGRMRVDTAKIAPLGAWPDYGLPLSATRSYPYSATIVGKNVQRLCLRGPAAASGACAELQDAVSAERGQSPVQTWDDKPRGRYPDFTASFA